MDDSYTTIAICNFNTTELTNACIRSIVKNIKSFKWKVVVLDNSNKIPFYLDKSIESYDEIIDNTNGKVIDFSTILKKFGKSFDETYGSLKHAYSI